MDIRDIYEAREKIKDLINPTILDRSSTFSDMCGCEIYLKQENQQKTGSFKIRGALNKILSLDEADKQKGVIAASAGNHAQGVALAAQKAGIEATIVMPVNAPLAKVNATVGYGAKVILFGESFDDALNKAHELQQETQAAFIHAFNDQKIIAGQGVVGLEILETLPEVDAIIVPIGGGGLISGISIAVKKLKPNVRIIGVQAENAACYKHSIEEGKIVSLNSVRTIADGIAIKKPGEINFEIIKKNVDDIVTVTEDEIASAILLLLEREKQVVEGSGAVSLAVALNHKIPLTNQKVVCILSGGNIDMNFIHKIIERGLIKAGRSMTIKTIISDKPGMLYKLTELIANQGANILNVEHDRYDRCLTIDATIIHIRMETNNSEHGQRVIEALKVAGYEIL